MKFINRTTRSAYLEMVNQDGDRELMFTLEAGQSYTATTLEKTYWFATMNRETDEGKKIISCRRGCGRSHGLSRTSLVETLAILRIFWFWMFVMNRTFEVIREIMVKIRMKIRKYSHLPIK